MNMIKIYMAETSLLECFSQYKKTCARNSEKIRLFGDNLKKIDNKIILLNC